MGNGAAKERQLDVYGYVLDAAWMHLQAWRAFASLADPALADTAAREWHLPDHGLSEMRNGRGDAAASAGG